VSWIVVYVVLILGGVLSVAHAVFTGVKCKEGFRWTSLSPLLIAFAISSIVVPFVRWFDPANNQEAVTNVAVGFLVFGNLFFLGSLVYHMVKHKTYIYRCGESFPGRNVAIVALTWVSMLIVFLISSLL
jgi:hypothetical protein